MPKRKTREQKRTIEKVYLKEILNTPRKSPWGKTTEEQKRGLEFGLNGLKKWQKIMG